jgi:hypothetical protein
MITNRIKLKDDMAMNLSYNSFIMVISALKNPVSCNMQMRISPSILILSGKINDD